MSDEISSIWFSSLRGTIGIVKKTNKFDTRFYIDVVDGIDKELDTKKILERGAKFPNQAGEALFNGR